MKPLHKNSMNEPIALELINSKKQHFFIWAIPAYNKAELIQILHLRKRLMFPVLMFYSNYDTCIFNMFNEQRESNLLCIRQDGCILNINESAHVCFPEEKISPECQKILLTSEKFPAMFSVTERMSEISIYETSVFNYSEFSNELIKHQEFSAEYIVRLAIADQRGTGLRSSFPTVYLWYHDVLFFINKFSFPGRAASIGLRPEAEGAIALLRKQNVVPVLRDAVFHSMFMSNTSRISPMHTWWGMENAWKFIVNF